MLGNNYDGDPQAFADELEDVLDELAPRPVVLLSVTEFETTGPRSTTSSREQAAQRPNVRVVEWAERTADDDGELLGGDGLHLSDAGRRELVADDVDGPSVGHRPASEGDCLPTRYTDDSTASPNWPTSSASGRLVDRSDDRSSARRPPGRRVTAACGALATSSGGTARRRPPAVGRPDPSAEIRRAAAPHAVDGNPVGTAPPC